MRLRSSENQPIKIVPKGLRSSDDHDADFFLELLPGSRDREGSPDTLLHGLRKRCLAREDNLTLKDSLAKLRRGHGIAVGKKVLIVLDPLEQWLHAGKEEENTELVQALRRCDGGRVQCIVMVRDDFQLAVSRFLRQLEIRLLEGDISALADLFVPEHARNVLAASGRLNGASKTAFGASLEANSTGLRLPVSPHSYHHRSSDLKHLHH